MRELVVNLVPPILSLVGLVEPFIESSYTLVYAAMLASLLVSVKPIDTPVEKGLFLG